LAAQFGLKASDDSGGEVVGSGFDSMGLGDKVQLVKNVAQTVQVSVVSGDTIHSHVFVEHL